VNDIERYVGTVLKGGGGDNFKVLFQPKRLRKLRFLTTADN
jgi:hypothetical protein